jgi:hypothetical protein
MITKEQVTAWVANNQIGYNSEADFIHQCIQDLTPTSEWISADDRLPIPAPPEEI